MPSLLPMFLTLLSCHRFIMPKINYRNQAREYLKRAKAELETEEDHRLRYAALDLRFAIEALTYDRAQAYKDELPSSEYETWQPRKLLALLLEIDPMADKGGSLAVGVEETEGEPAPEMVPFGSETVFDLRLLKKHYDAIGNFLHVPTLAQAEKAPPPPEKFRQRCVQVSEYVGKALASAVWNITLGSFATMECENCGAKIRRRMPHGQKTVSAACFECEATYTITDRGNGKVEWKMDMVDVRCGNPDCDKVIHILKKELKPGSHWVCEVCHGKNVIALAIRHEPGERAASAS
ncbi:hypothetical protein V6R85_24055 [Agrobacterium sp. CCNWLW32]|uniref:hypothetical protein n=1 Tax=Agrobacterium sp. CCNWLW32 TaxID=3122072 RepID=UPI0030104503